MSKILEYPDSRLSCISKEIDFTEAPGIHMFQIEMLKEALEKLPSGVGLAFPQIGIQKRGFAMRYKTKEITIVLNPKITKRKYKQKNTEGCFSLPNIFEEIERDDIITVEYYNEREQLVKQKLRGYHSAIFQHEYDHLDGILLIDKLSSSKQEEIKNKLGRI